MKRLRAWLRFVLWVLAAPWAAAAPQTARVLDDFSQPAAWQASASDQVQAVMRRDRDGSLCLDYDFGGVSGYAVMRRELPMEWPQNFDVHTRLKALGGVNHFQFKVVDASGDNVWWVNRPDATLPTRLHELRLRRRHFEFAWGPTADRSLVRTQYLEYVVAAGRDGGKGSLCVASLALLEREPAPAAWPEPRTTRRGQVLHIDWGVAREFNGLALHWPDGAGRVRYQVLASDDQRHWRVLRQGRSSLSGRDALFLPESEARWLRLRLPAAAPTPAVNLRSAAEWPSFNAVLASLAAGLPKGSMPRAFIGQQNYWTLVGVDGGAERSGLLSEDGALELGRGGPSVEPAVWLQDGRAVTWANVQARHSLREGHLPVPAVHWQHPALGLTIEAVADGTPAAPELLARYVLHNPSAQTQTYSLLLALRPWQVNPPQQFLATPGGASPLPRLHRQAGVLWAQAQRPLRTTQTPERVTALPFDAGLGLEALRSAPELKDGAVLVDPQGHGSAGLHFQVTLAPGARHTIGLVAPLGDKPAAPAPLRVADIDARFDAAAAQWHARLNRVQVQWPAGAQVLGDTLRASLAHMLMSREGAGLRPGTRSYGRSWVRDGAMMVAGLVRLGETDVAREFVDWYAGHIYASGKVPCCVSPHGADPVAENDSHGQYLFAVAEVWRHTRDLAFLQRHGPQVQRVLAYMEGLRQSERGAANRTPQRAHFFGLMPPSISHEGYSDKPAYSYWDDFWALRGYKDAVIVARALGHEAQAQAWQGLRDEFESELAQSIAATARVHGLDHIAGAADRGDFDATSTTMALNPAQARLPQALLQATFERYWREMSARSAGSTPWKDYTPYELRTVGAFVRLGQAGRAHAMLEFFFRHQRPQGWHQWAEVVLPDAREPRFLGDMPHAWVSSDYVRSVLDLLAWEREADGAVLLAAGAKPEWLAQGGLAVRDLSTPHGRLSYRLAPTPGGWQFEWLAPAPPAPGGHRLVWPGDGALPTATQAGRALAWQGRELILPDTGGPVLLSQP